LAREKGPRMGVRCEVWPRGVKERAPGSDWWAVTVGEGDMGLKRGPTQFK
jgi:hypothetical protein